MHRRTFVAGLLAGSLVGTSAGGVAGLALVRAAGDDPSGQYRRVVEHLDYQRRLAEQRADLAERLLADQARHGGFATLPAPMPPPLPLPAGPLPGDDPADRIPPQQLPVPARPAGE